MPVKYKTCRWVTVYINTINKPKGWDVKAIWEGCNKFSNFIFAFQLNAFYVYSFLDVSLWCCSREVLISKVFAKKDFKI